MGTWLSDNAAPLLAFLGVVITALLAAWGGWLAYQSNRKKAAADREANAGTLALGLAEQLGNRLDKVETELGRHRRFRDAVEDWGREHERYDDAVVRELERSSPGAIDRLPARHPMPQFDPVH